LRDLTEGICPVRRILWPLEVDPDRQALCKPEKEGNIDRHCKKVWSFQASFGPRYRVGQILAYFLPKKAHFCTFWLLTSTWSTFWLWSLRQEIQYTVKKCPKIAWNLNMIFYSVEHAHWRASQFSRTQR